MSERDGPFAKPDRVKSEEARDNWLKVPEDEDILVTIDNVEPCKIKTDGGLKDGVKVTCRLVGIKKVDDEYICTPDQKELFKESYSTSSFHLLDDFDRASHWPKEGLYYWVFHNSKGLAWQEAQYL